MEHLHRLFKLLNWNESILEITKGNIYVPYLTGFKNPAAYWYAHPPAMVPVFLGNGPSYYGLLVHFFFEREKVFVEYSLEWGYMLEYARNMDQFFALMVLEMDMVAEGLDDKILKFCGHIGFKEFKQVDEFADSYGNIMENYQHLVHLTDNTPLTYLEHLNLYNGNYPSSEKLFNPEQIYNCCTFEIADPKYLAQVEQLPSWFKNEIPQKELFERYVKNDDLKSAWLTLNSSGWELEDIASGLQVLKTKTEDPLFHLVANQWINSFRQREILPAC